MLLVESVYLLSMDTPEALTLLVALSASEFAIVIDERLATSTGIKHWIAYE